MPDPNMNTALQWANELGPIPKLPKSLKAPLQRAKLVDRIDGPLIANSLLYQLSENEKKKRIEIVSKMTEDTITDVEDAKERAKISLRLWAGCISAAKMASPRTADGLITPEIRKSAFEDIVDYQANYDQIYSAGVEVASLFKCKVQGEIYLTDGIPNASPFRKYIK